MATVLVGVLLLVSAGIAVFILYKFRKSQDSQAGGELLGGQEVTLLSISRRRRESSCQLRASRRARWTPASQRWAATSLLGSSECREEISDKDFISSSSLPPSLSHLPITFTPLV